MAIYGSIEEAGLPDVLQLLALGRRTGCLSVVDGEMHGEIYLAAGRIAYATVSGKAERFGETLVKGGLITREQLQRAIDEQSQGPQRQLGRILVDSGQIDRSDLDRFVRRQVEESVYYLFARKKGEFSFVADKRTSHQALLEPFDAESLLLEGARRVDEWGQIQRKIPSFDLVYRHTQDTHNLAVAAELTDAQRRILPLLDGAHDVNAVVETTGMDEFEVGKALYGLVMAGFVQLVERRAAIRHLDYRELLAWVVREAEFADPQRRKDAGRHIVDCPTCAERLRRIQVRRTEGTVVAAAAALSAGGAGGGARVSQGGQRVEPAPPHVSAAGATSPERRHGERRVRERRAGLDRRQGDRRAGHDRRRGLDASWAQANVERRVGPRRADERRPARGERRSGNGDVRVMEPSAEVPAAERPAAGERITEPRFAPRVASDEGRERPERANASEAREEEAAARAAELARDYPELAAEAAPPEEAGALPEGRSARSRDIEWIVSPEESDDMLRASRAARREAGPAGPRTRIPPEDGRAPQGLRPPGQLTRGGAGSRPRQGARETFLGVDWRGIPWRPFGVAAAILVIALAGYGAGRIAKVGGGARTAVPPVAQAPSAPAAPPRTEEPGPLRPIRPEPVSTVTAAPPVRTTPESAPRTEPARPQPSPTQARAAAEPRAARPAPPTVGTVRGVVRGPGGAAVPGARVSVRGTSLAAVADVSGAFEIREVPEGDVTLIASADGYLPDTVTARARAGAAVAADLALARPGPPPAPAAAAPVPVPTVTAAEPDRELSEGGWNVVSRAEALGALGGTFGAIRGLPIESVAKSTAGSRTRVRVAQLTESGQRIVLLETRAGAAVRGGEGPAAVTALRVLPASEAYPFATGTASFGNILITAKSTVPAETLRSLLGRLSEVAP